MSPIHFNMFNILHTATYQQYKWKGKTYMSHFSQKYTSVINVFFVKDERVFHPNMRHHSPVTYIWRLTNEETNITSSSSRICMSTSLSKLDL